MWTLQSWRIPIQRCHCFWTRQHEFQHRDVVERLTRYTDANGDADIVPLLKLQVRGEDDQGARNWRDSAISVNGEKLE